MKYKIEFTAKAKKQALALDVAAQTRIRNAIRDKLEIDADNHLIALSGDLQGLYKFRVGNYRLLCAKEQKCLIITIVRVAHRREVYH
jgi:mRNA interferase RelE/StbE